MAQGCAQFLYDELQTKQREDCYRKNSPSGVQACLDNTDMTYEEYEKIRKEDKK